MQYRPEIDGLRALAVVPVILFHAGFAWIGGGYVGVDVFFVISGYLITGLLLNDVQGSGLSLGHFYERRARRILPALFLVMAVSLPFALWLLLPQQLTDYSKSLAAVSLFASNILFWKETGYFDTVAALKPLIHTWSLSVEEQFYVIFPLVFAGLWFLARRYLLWLLLAATLLSLAAAHWAALTHPVAAFYLLPARAWELAMGAAIAVYLAGRPGLPAPRGLAEGGGLLGLALILGSALIYDSQTPFPSLYALVPTLGAGLIILLATPATLTGRLLASKPFVAIGLISYSAYLWHQPLFAFARQRSALELPPAIYGLLALLALVLAAVSWRFVEQPFRNKAFLTRRAIFALALCGSLFFLGVGLAGSFTGGAFGRGEGFARLQAIDAQMGINNGLSDACDAPFENLAACRTSETPEVLVWGDSYGMHLMQGLLASRPGLGVVQATQTFCGPFLDIAPVSTAFVKKWAGACMASNDAVLAYLQATPSIKYVLVASLMTQYAGPGAKVMRRDGTITSDQAEILATAAQTLEKIKALGRVPVLFSFTPQTGRNLGHCLAKSQQFGEDMAQCDFPLDAARAHQRPMLDFLNRLGAVAPVVQLSDGLCADGICRTREGGQPLFRDEGHFSPLGSAIIGKKLDFYGQLTAAR